MAAKKSSDSLGPDESQDMVQVTCRRGHTHWYNKRKACTENNEIVRGVGDEEDRLSIPCEEAGCTERVTLYARCKEYR